MFLAPRTGFNPAPYARLHYTYCPKCAYFNDTCDCADQPHNHHGIEHDNCERPTNAWPIRPAKIT